MGVIFRCAKHFCLLTLLSGVPFRPAAAQTIEGNVVNSVTGSGVAGVRVDLIWAGDTYYSATTDAQGHFLFDHVQDGAYRVLYSSPDYWWDRDPGPARQFQVTAGGNPVKLEAHMTPLARLSGRVVDGRGQAVPGAEVLLTGPRRMMSSPTDANGRFDLRKDLIPDAYTLSVAPPPDLKPPDPEPESDGIMNWTTTWFPGVATSKAASKIVLPPGGEVSDLELKLLAVPAHAVRGVLLKPDGKRAPKVAISMSGALALLSTESKPDGAFEFPAVVDGEWSFSAEVGVPSGPGGVKLRVTQWIEMAGRELEGVKVHLTAPFTLGGKVVMETAKGAPAPRQPLVSLVLHASPSVRASFGDNPHSWPDADGNLRFENVYPGTYRIDVLGELPAYYLDSVRVGEAEPSTPEVEISSGAAPITVVYKTNGGAVRGTAERCLSGGVELVPQDPAMRRPGFFYSAPCDANDRYEIGAVRPGEYYALAFAGGDPDPWYRSRWDDALLNQAARVTVRAGEASSADLRAIAQPPY